MLIEEIQLLFEYYYWATDQIVGAGKKVRSEQFTQRPSHHQRSLRATLVHALSSECNWRVRWQGKEPDIDLDEQSFPTVSALQMYWKGQEQEMRTFLTSIQPGDLDRIIEGTTDEGTIYADSVWQSMIQVLFHGAQHRSEAAMMLTEYGCSPGELDFFVFLRQKERVREGNHFS